VTRKAIIVGSAGQDGRLLTEHLVVRGYEVIGVDRYNHDISDSVQIQELVHNARADEIYYLAAHHQSSEGKSDADTELLKQSYVVNVMALGYFLQAALKGKEGCGIFYASSSHVFSGGTMVPLNEESPKQPASIYALTKLAGMQLCEFYRTHYGLKASSGILFNHESPFRRPGFLSKQIAMAAARIAKEGEGELVVGNLDAVVDWGAAEDFVDAMHRVLQLKQGGDFIIATGIPHTVSDFARVAFEHVGLDHRKYVRVSPGKIGKRPTTLIGNPAKLMETTGWKATRAFHEMVASLVDFELARLGHQ